MTRIPLAALTLAALASGAAAIANDASPSERCAPALGSAQTSQAQAAMERGGAKTAQPTSACVE